MAGSYDVIVVGVGAMGSAACAELARRGARVLGLEQFDIPHTLGSSGGHTRLVRKAYFEHPDYVPLLERSYAGWRALEAASGCELWFPTGLVYAGPSGGEVVAGVLRAAAQHDLAVEQPTSADARARWPALRVPEHYECLHEADAGFVLCERAVAAFARVALDRGADLRAREEALGVRAEPNGVEVRTARGTYRARRLVVTAGGWAPALLAELGVPLRPTRQVVAWTWPAEPAALALGSFPCWAIEADEPGGGLWYGFPLLPAALAAGGGTKVGLHRIGPTVDPDRVDRTPSASELDELRAGLRRLLPAADGEVLAAHVCLYTMSPDGQFVVGVHPARTAVVVACGFSGHGFKFAPVMGEALADLALEGRTALPIGFLRPERFQ
jgi:sarcosine oxidase